MKKTTIITGLSAIALSSVVPTASADTTTNDSYTVQAGDTLQKIAAKFGVTVDTLRANNQLGKYLTIGQKLIITQTSANFTDTSQALPSGSTAEFANALAATASQTNLSDHYFTSVMIAQAILESQSGRSGLAQNYNNYFGIKGAYEGQSINLSTQEEVKGSYTTINASFRVYPSPAASVQDYVDLFTRTSWASSHYAKFINAKTPAEATQALTGIYATDSAYGTKLLQLINTYQLEQYDTQAANNPNTTGDTTFTTYKVKDGDTLKKNCD
ncbi:glycoside hydrolase family 73 protein [Brochothrix campestris]|uniref:Peptidoglycan hydrolase n=1 Tax=Brochothrix campestris FSL F6-1037 TaxID=1265861 RepID=W7CQI8_9LIST|nr:glucosaminidase domain-containing protein [Brochothrix campestris]EUJ41889.1 gamma-D-glutamate-meso-diaminopimelate muropeptidase [Brochothrix campestris FSL F6-1037]